MCNGGSSRNVARQVTATGFAAAIGLALAVTFLAARISPDATSVPARPGVAHAVYAFDPADDEALAAYATDIVVGRVVAQTGAAGAPTSAPGQELPQSQFSVAVLASIKGDAGGVVTVNQVGGFDRQAGHMLLLEGDALLRPRQTEIFILHHVPVRGWYQIVAAGHGHRSANDPTQLEALATRFSQAVADDDLNDPAARGSWEAP